MEQTENKRILVVSRKKPYVTYTFIAICVLIFIADFGLRLYFAWKYNADVSIIKYYGIKSNELIKAGQIWRLLTAVFLHANGLEHIGFNMLALFLWGRHIEALYDRWRYVVIFLLAGIMSTAASFAFTDANSLGASGAIYGMFGALLYFRKYNKELFNKIFGVQIFVYLGLSLFLGFTQTYVDNFGHLGGLVGGYLAARAVGLLTQKFEKRKGVVLSYISYFVVFTVLMLIGFLR